MGERKTCFFRSALIAHSYRYTIIQMSGAQITEINILTLGLMLFTPRIFFKQCCENFLLIFNPLTLGAFRQKSNLVPRVRLPKRHFWTFWRFLAWKWAILAPIYSKRHLQHGSMPFFPLLAPPFTTVLETCDENKISKFESYWTRK